MEKTFLLSHGELKLFCRLSEPDYGPVRRVVLGVHGLGGSSRDTIQAGIAEEMALFGAVTLRFDFPAHGESPLDSDGLTLDNCRDSLLAAARWAKAQYPEVEDLCVFAYGFGGYMVLNTLEELLELPGKIKLVLQTPAVRLHETILALGDINEPTFRAMDRITVRASRPLDITYGFYEEIQKNLVLTSHPAPMLIIHAEEDDLIRTEHIQNFHRINEDSKLVILPHTGHRFLEEGAWDMVLDLTRDWFEFEQVLCCDWE